MKILVVCQYYYPEPFRITDICETLVRRGHEVTVLTGLPNYPEGIMPAEYRKGKKRQEKINGVNIIRTYEIARGNNAAKLFLNYFSFALSASIKAYFMKEDFDVVFVNQLSPVMMGIPAKIYKKRRHKKVLLYCLDLWPESLAAGGIRPGSMVYKIFLKISQNIYKSADMILVTSTMFKEYFRDTLGLSMDKIEFLPQYAEEIFEINNTIESNKMMNEKKEFNFVFAGNIGDLQSVETIIRAANELKNNETVMFHIVGDGSKLADCKNLSQELSLKNIIFHGRKPVEEMPDFYDMADAMLITLKNNQTLSYTLPGKMQSYMAAGKPVLGAINGETQLVIRESGCGLCCTAEDYKGLAGNIIHFINNENKEQMGVQAKKYYKDNYSKENFLDKLEKALMSLGA